MINASTSLLKVSKAGTALQCLHSGHARGHERTERLLAPDNQLQNNAECVQVQVRGGIAFSVHALALQLQQLDATRPPDRGLIAAMRMMNGRLNAWLLVDVNCCVCVRLACHDCIDTCSTTMRAACKPFQIRPQSRQNNGLGVVQDVPLYPRTASKREMQNAHRYGHFQMVSRFVWNESHGCRC
jgi:hypothetical protein